MLRVGRVEHVLGSGILQIITRQRGELGDPLRGRCNFSGRCTEIGGSRDPVTNKFQGSSIYAPRIERPRAVARRANTLQSFFKRHTHRTSVKSNVRKTERTHNRRTLNVQHTLILHKTGVYSSVLFSSNRIYIHVECELQFSALFVFRPANWPSCSD